jgi:hypothetical protein
VAQHVIGNGDNAQNASIRMWARSTARIGGRISHAHSVAVFEGATAIGETAAVKVAEVRAIKPRHDVTRLKSAIERDRVVVLSPHRIDVTQT